MNRRDALLSSLALATGVLGAGAGPAPAHAHDALGPVQPARPSPTLPLVLHDGRRTSLPAQLAGRWTALQLIFTGCSATCPLQGAVFAGLQGLVASDAQVQLLSVSTDPLHDDAQALAEWRAKFGAGAAWHAAAPPVAEADALRRFVEPNFARPNPLDRHLAQTYLFDAQGRLAYRCAELASAADIARSLQLVRQRSRG